MKHTLRFLMAAMLFSSQGMAGVPPMKALSFPLDGADARAKQRALAWIPAEKPKAVLLCLHGIQTHAEWFQPLGERMAAEGYAVYALDRRGSGTWANDPKADQYPIHQKYKGDVQDWHQWINDINLAAKTVTALHPGVPLYVTGVSWGGKTALGALVGDCKCLFAGGILIAPAFQTSVDPSWFKRSLLPLVATFKPQGRHDLKAVLTKDLYTDNEDIQRQWIVGDKLLLGSVTNRFANESNRQLAYAQQQLASVQGNVLALFGTSDCITKNYESDQVLLPLRKATDFSTEGKGLTTFLIRRLNHASLVEQPDILAATIQEWLRAVHPTHPQRPESFWVPAYVTGHPMKDGKVNVGRAEFKRSPRGFATGLLVAKGKPVKLAWNPTFLWEDEKSCPNGPAGLPPCKEGQIQGLFRTTRLAPKENYLSLLASIEDSQGHVTLEPIPFKKEDKSVVWKPSTSGKLSFIANDATTFPSMIYGNNLGTLKLRIK